MDRHEELLTSVETLLAAHAAWQETDNPEISAELVQRIEDAITVFSGGDMPGDLLEMYAKMQSLNEAWTAAVMDAEDPEHIQVNRAAKFWKALDCVRQLCARREDDELAEFRPLESVAMLTHQKVSDQQICWIYRGQWADGAKSGPGLWDWARKRPLLHLLEKERREPGSVIGADFEPFSMAQKKQEAAKRRAAADRAAAARQARIAKIAKPCPETLEELVMQGVSLTQIARMKRTTKADIRKQCEAAGLPEPDEEYEALKSDFSPELNDAQIRRDEAQRPMPAARSETPSAETEAVSADDDFGGPADVDLGELLVEGEKIEPLSDAERLVAAYMDGGATAAGEIARAIKSDGGPELRAGDVKGIMGRLKGDPERFQAALAQ